MQKYALKILVNCIALSKQLCVYIAQLIRYPDLDGSVFWSGNEGFRGANKGLKISSFRLERALMRPLL